MSSLNVWLVLEHQQQNSSPAHALGGGQAECLKMYPWLYSMKTFHQLSDFWEFGWIIFSYFSAQMKAARFQKMRTFSVKSY